MITALISICVLTAIILGGIYRSFTEESRHKNSIKLRFVLVYVILCIAIFTLLPLVMADIQKDMIIGIISICVLIAIIIGGIYRTLSEKNRHKNSVRTLFIIFFVICCIIICKYLPQVLN